MENFQVSFHSTRYPHSGQLLECRSTSKLRARVKPKHTTTSVEISMDTRSLQSYTQVIPIKQKFWCGSFTTSGTEKCGTNFAKLFPGPEKVPLLCTLPKNTQNGRSVGSFHPTGQIDGGVIQVGPPVTGHKPT